jgi:hypothetical protein
VSGDDYSRIDINKGSEFEEYRGNYKENKLWEAWKEEDIKVERV